MRNTQRGSQSYMEKRRGMKEVEVTRRRRGRVKRRETNLANNQFHVLHNLKHPKRFTELSREEKGDGGGRGELEEKRESQKGRAIKPVITPLSENGYCRLDP